MPRIGRQLSKTNIYHVMIRGNERRKIFLDDEDRERFLDTIREKKLGKSFEILAYCLMDNHVHLVLDVRQENIAKIMQSINVSYVYYFNKKYERTGHLFQDRFKSEGIENERYLLAAVRYVHNNPVKAGITVSPVGYRWSSYNFFINKRMDSELIDMGRVLSIFADEEKTAVKLFEQFSMEAADDRFFDVQEEGKIKKAVHTIMEARTFMTEYMYSKGLKDTDIKENKNTRNQLIRELKAESNLSIRDIAELLGVDRNVVQRAN